MNIEYDEDKRRRALEERGLDFADAGRVFDGPEFTQQDDRFDYPEPRFQTYGLLDERLVMLAWTPTRNGIRVISMRRCNDREYRKFANRLG
ncbi:MAG: BrnT family toxin [Proteobacteria bacterium]|nr:BrnT family toxin [Pseudomonadota bacterium]